MPRAEKLMHRFPVGTRVECNTGDWSPGVVVAHDHREDAWPANKTVPYQIRLDGGRLIYAPHDSNHVIRRAPTAIIHTLLEEQDIEGLRAQCKVNTKAQPRQRQVQLLNAPNRVGEPPITSLFLREKDPKWIITAAGILEQGGADMGATDKNGGTVLHHAARSGNMALVDLALLYCPDLNLQDVKGGDYRNGSWVKVEEDTRYMTDEEKEGLAMTPVEEVNDTVSLACCCVYARQSWMGS